VRGRAVRPTAPRSASRVSVAVARPYDGAAGVSAQTSVGSRARGRAVTTCAGRPRCSRIFLAVALSVIAARRRRRLPQCPQRRTSSPSVFSFPLA
jgi:hypothetical protein